MEEERKTTYEELKKGYEEMAKLNLTLANEAVQSDNEAQAQYELYVAEREKSDNKTRRNILRRFKSCCRKRAGRGQTCAYNSE